MRRTCGHVLCSQQQGPVNDSGEQDGIVLGCDWPAWSYDDTRCNCTSHACKIVETASRVQAATRGYGTFSSRLHVREPQRLGATPAVDYDTAKPSRRFRHSSPHWDAEEFLKEGVVLPSIKGSQIVFPFFPIVESSQNPLLAVDLFK